MTLLVPGWRRFTDRWTGPQVVELVDPRKTEALIVGVKNPQQTANGNQTVTRGAIDTKIGAHKEQQPSCRSR